jgi:hypothetical protein
VDAVEAQPHRVAPASSIAQFLRPTVGALPHRIALRAAVELDAEELDEQHVQNIDFFLGPLPRQCMNLQMEAESLKLSRSRCIVQCPLTRTQAWTL